MTSKQIQILFTQEDERALSRALQAVRPSVVFYDDNIWPSASPQLVPSLDRCKTLVAGIWDTALARRLPVAPLGDGRYAASATGPAIQFLRSIQLPHCLKAGRIAGTTSAPTRIQASSELKFLNETLKLVQALSSPAYSFDPETAQDDLDRHFRIGLHAIEWANSDQLNVLQDRSTGLALRASTARQTAPLSKRRIAKPSTRNPR